MKVGLFAAGGALLRLPGRLPEAVAIEMALTGDPITAEVAHQYGLVSRLVEPGEAVATAVWSYGVGDTAFERSGHRQLEGLYARSEP